MPQLDPAYGPRHPKNAAIARKNGYAWDENQRAYLDRAGRAMRTGFAYDSARDKAKLSYGEAVHAHK